MPIESTPDDSFTGPGTLHPETQKNIGSMAESFKKAMGKVKEAGDGKGTPAPAPAPPREPAPVPAPAPAPAPQPDPEPSGDPDPEKGGPEPRKESRSARDFKLIKQERDAAKARAEELEQKYRETSERLDLYSDYDRIRAENEELNKTLTITNLERHPKFQKEFVEPINNQINRATAYVPEESRAAVAKALRMPLGDERTELLDKLTADLPPSRQAYLQGTINRIDEIAFERDKQLEDSKGSLERIQEEDRKLSEKKSAERNKELEKSFDSVLKEAQENIDVFQLREGDEEWNNSVRERVNLAKNILMEQNSFEDAATAALWAASGGALLEQNAALVEHNRRLNEELSKFKQVEPSPAGSTKPGNPARPSSGENSFSNRVLGELRGLGMRNAG